MPDNPIVLPLTQVGTGSLPLAGGKGAQLGAMLGAGLPVPDGFCVTTHAYRGGMTPALRDAIARAYEAMGAPPVAVRSSATAEDLPDASFAGQQDTILNVRGADAVVAAVQQCWQSLFTERAVAYRRDRNIADAGVAMAVVVQRMVDADAAGVMFTVNPVSGAIDELVIEAALGLGDKVVSAQVTPDRFRVRRRAPHDVIDREGHETGDALAASLPPLVELGLACERLLGRAADVEWAIAGGRVFLLQSRTVTTAGVRKPAVRFSSRFNAEFAKDHLVFWGNYNLRDTMPFPHTPFSWSFWNYLTMPSILKGTGLIDHVDEYDSMPAMSDLVDGRAYFNMNYWEAMFRTSRFPKLGVRMAGLLDAELPGIMEPLLKSRAITPMAKRFGLRRGLRALYRVWLHSDPKQAWADLEFSRRETDELRKTDVSALSEEQIVALARYFATENIPRTLFPLLAAGPSLVAAVVLNRCLERWKVPHLFPSLISGLGSNPTVETALAMWDVAESADDIVREVFAREQIAQVPALLAQSESGREFLAHMAEFLRVHGHRAVREFDFSCPRWKDDPAFVYESVRNYLLHPPNEATPRQRYERQKQEHEAAKQELWRATQGRPLRRLLAEKLVRVIEERMPLREAFKFYTLYGTAFARDLLLQVAGRLVERGLLKNADDYFFLTIPEIEKLSRGELEQSWMDEQVPQRRRELATYMRIDPPLVVRSDGQPVARAKSSGATLKGTGASPGVVRGPARVLFDPNDGAMLRTGEILVAKFTDPSWTPLFLTASGLIMEVGGIISHGAIVAREYGLPAVVGVKDATRVLRQGEMVEVNGATGEIIRLETDAATFPETVPGVDIEWTRSNLREVMPDLPAPQVLDVVCQLLDRGQRLYGGRFWAPQSELGPTASAFFGRPYFNLDQVRYSMRMAGQPPSKILRALGHSGGIAAEDEVAGPIPWGRLLRATPDLLRIVWYQLSVGSMIPRFLRWMDRMVADRTSFKIASLSDKQLADSFDGYMEAMAYGMRPIFALTGVLDIEEKVRALLRRKGFRYEEVALPYLAAGEKSVSSQQAFDLLRLAASARDEQRVREYFESTTDLSDFRAKLAGSAFLPQFESFLAKYGHRGPFESDWSLPKYREDPTPLLNALQAHVKSERFRSPEAIAREQEEKAAEAWQRFESRLTWFERRTLAPIVRRMLDRIRQMHGWRELYRSEMVRHGFRMRQLHLALAERFVARGWIDKRDDYFILLYDEIFGALRGKGQDELKAIVQRRRDELARWEKIEMPLHARESQLRNLSSGAAPKTALSTTLVGTPVSAGIVEGTVVVVQRPDDFSRMKPGAILVAPATDPAWTPLFTLASGVIVEIGGLLSHASIVAREYGLPAIANVADATRILRDGDRVRLDANEGRVEIIARASAGGV